MKLSKAALSFACAMTAACSSLYAEAPTAQFLLVGQGARAVAMGQAVVSNCFDHSSMYWNPAAMVFMQSPTLGAGATQLPADISIAYLSFCGPANVKKRTGIGFSIIHEGTDVQSYDSFGSPGKMLSLSDIAVQTAFAFKIGESFAFSPTMGIVGMNLDTYTSDPAFNFGLSTIYVRSRFSAAFVLANMGSKIQFRDERSELIGPGQPQPALSRFGLSYSVLRNKNLLFSYSTQNVNEDKAASWSALGAEWLPNSYIALRAGTRSLEGGSTVPSFGFGLNYKRISFDYAQTMAPSDLEGMTTSRFDLQFRFNNFDPSMSKVIKPAKPVVRQQAKAVVEQPQQPTVVIPAQQPQFFVPSAGMEVSTIAVAEFTGKNVSQADASIVSDFMRTELVNTAAFKLVEKANMDKLLAEAAFQQSGCSAADCAVKMGKILNVRYMMVGSVSKLLDTYYITVNLVSVETGEILRSYNQEASSARELKDGCRVLAVKVANDKPSPSVPIVIEGGGAPAAPPADGQSEKMERR